MNLGDNSKCTLTLALSHDGRGDTRLLTYLSYPNGGTIGYGLQTRDYAGKIVFDRNVCAASLSGSGCGRPSVNGRKVSCSVNSIGGPERSCV